jgi:hypothetical protein
VSGVRYGSQFTRLSQASLDANAPLTTTLARTFVDDVCALKASVLVPPLVWDHRATFVVSTITTTVESYVTGYAARQVPAGYSMVRGTMRVRRGSSCTSSPTVTVYSDARTPLDTTNAATVSERARRAVVTVLSRSWLEYPFELVLVRDPSDATHLSLWSTADGAGANRQPEISDVDITVKHLVDDGTFGAPAIPVSTWR